MALGTANGVAAVATSEATDVTAGESAVTADGAPPPPFHVPEDAEDATPAASSSPGVALGTADGVTAATTSATETDPDVETDPVPAATAPPNTGDTTATVLRAATPAHTADGTSRV